MVGGHRRRGRRDVSLPAPLAELRAGRAAEASATQRRAADPATSAWVTASAGSGKTKVLTDRLLSLLLSGTEPGRILCLTFTKAAAAEMANRLARRLSRWAGAPDSGLRSDLAELLGRAPEENEAFRARTLFARVLDAPGGMKIQTIHAFCQSLLGRFPLEAGIAPHFQVLDERTAAEMLDGARAEVLAAALKDGGGGLADEIDEITAHTHEQGFGELIEKLLRERGRLTRAIREHLGVEGVAREIYRLLEADPRVTAEDLRLAGCADEAVDRKGLELAADALAAGSDAEGRSLAILRDWLASGARDRAARLDAYMAIFVTGDGQVRKRLLTKKAAAAVPEALEIMVEEAERLLRLRARVGAATVARATAALLRLGAEIVAAYDRHKRTRGLLDYDDLILEARELLTQPGRAAWVLYKLDRGIDHMS